MPKWETIHEISWTFVPRVTTKGHVVKALDSTIECVSFADFNETLTAREPGLTNDETYHRNALQDVTMCLLNLGQNVALVAVGITRH